MRTTFCLTLAGFVCLCLGLTGPNDRTSRRTTHKSNCNLAGVFFKISNSKFIILYCIVLAINLLLCLILDGRLMTRASGRTECNRNYVRGDLEYSARGPRQCACTSVVRALP